VWEIELQNKISASAMRSLLRLEMTGWALGDDDWMLGMINKAT